MRLLNSCLKLCASPPQRGNPANRGNPAGQHDFPRVDVHQPRHWNADQHIEDDVGRPDQEAQFLVGQVEIDLDTLGHQTEYAGIEEIEHGRQYDDGIARSRRPRAKATAAACLGQAPLADAAIPVIPPAMLVLLGQSGFTINRLYVLDTRRKVLHAESARKDGIRDRRCERHRARDRKGTAGRGDERGHRRHPR